MAKKKLSVSKNTVVSIHYTVKDSANGKKIESSLGEEPLTYLHGHDQIITGLEKALKGKGTGDKMSITVTPGEGYGEYNNEMVMTLPKAQFKDQKQLKVGSIFQFADQNGQPVVVRIKEVKGDSVIVDGNHPFAGLTLNFDVEVVSIRQATKSELEHGHAHTDDHGHC